MEGLIFGISRYLGKAVIIEGNKVYKKNVGDASDLLAHVRYIFKILT